jgi:hypothetical protein
LEQRTSTSKSATCVLCDVSPHVPGDGKRVDATGDHREPLAQVVRGQGAGDVVADGTDGMGLCAGIDGGLFDGVDPQVNGGQASATARARWSCRVRAIH